ncbi:MAG: TIGR03862 family flavoprotein [Pseudomonadota bacterium]
MTDCLVMGGGPAGLMAADMVSAAGFSVIVADAMPTLGRKFLMAGKSGLNLTKAEPLAAFQRHYAGAVPHLAPMIAAFGPQEVGRWAEGLGQPVFTGSTGRVFPSVMKASPLLRAWLRRLDVQGVDVRLRHRWVGWDGDVALFDAPDGPVRIKAKTTVLAMGGASWRRLGSDGGWAEHVGETAPFQPANMGFAVDWSPHMAPFFGQAVKGCGLTAADLTGRGEFVISKRGLEGGGIYEVSRRMREGARLMIDLVPDLGVAEVETRLARASKKDSLANVLRKALKLDPVKRALLNEFGRGDTRPLAEQVKALELPILSPHPMDEAISTAGGQRFDALDEDLMLKNRPGTYAAGEMLDWEAPTGGYLLTACFATGRWAGLAAVRRLQTS